MKIKICRKFTDIHTLQKKLTKAFPHDDIVIRKCLGMCKRCKTQPVAKAAKKKFKAKRISTLIEKLNAVI